MLILYVYDYKTFSDEFILQEKFIDTNGVIRRRKVKKTDNTMTKRQRDKRTNNDVQNTTQNTTKETKDRATRSLLKIESVPSG
jgi:hypothetical protein